MVRPLIYIYKKEKKIHEIIMYLMKVQIHEIKSTNT